MGLDLFPPTNKHIPIDKFSLKSLYFRFFGPVALPYPFPISFNNIQENRKKFEEVELSPGESTRPLRGDFDFGNMLGGEYALPTKLGLTPDDMYQLPNEPILSLKGGKRIKTTTIRRGKGHGDVKEERALKGTRIMIRGLCINETNADYPEDQVTKIREMVEAAGAIHIKNYLTSLWGMNKVSVMNWNMPRTSRDVMHVQPYTIELVSDFDFDDFNRIMEEETNNATN